MSQQLPHLKFLIGDGPRPSSMFGLADTGDGLNLENMDYHQSVAERHTNLVLKFAYLKDLDNVDPFNYQWSIRRKRKRTGKRKGRNYYSNYVQNPLHGKWKSGDSLPCTWIRGGMQHQLFISTTANN